MDLIGGNRLRAELSAINDEAEAGELELERLVKLPAAPNGVTLSTARLRFSRVLRRHLELVDGAIMPHLREVTDATAKPVINDFSRLLHDYHEAAAHQCRAVALDERDDRLERVDGSRSRHRGAKMCSLSGIHEHKGATRCGD